MSGLGVELMAASDNVLRGGLTQKHVDVPELLDVLDFTTGTVPLFQPEKPASGIAVFRPDVPDFRLVRLEVGQKTAGAELAVHGPAVVFCAAGEIRSSGFRGEILLARGDSVYITPDEDTVRCTGEGTVFFATTNYGLTAG